MKTKTGHVVTDDGKRIFYDHYLNGHTKALILAHGFFNSKEAVLFKEMALALNDDYDVIVMDFRGHGKSEGFFEWTAKEYLDMEAVLKYAHQRYPKVGVIGFSLGAASSMITASKINLIDSLIVVSPPSDFDKIDKHYWTMGFEENIIYNIFGQGRNGKGVKPGNLWLPKIRPIDIVSEINIPIFFIHGQKDWLILPWHSEELYKKAQSKKKLVIVEGGSHAEYLFRKNAEETIKLFKDWFKETL